MCQETQVAYCGLYCGNCIIRKGKIGHLANALLQTINKPEFCKLANGLPTIRLELFEPLENYHECVRVLDAMRHLDCCSPCREGGGSSECQIRQCCLDKKIGGCWQCHEWESCDTLSWLNSVHKGSHLANLKIIQEKGIQHFLAGNKLW